MTAGRKPNVLAQVPALIDLTLDQPKLNQAMAQMRADEAAQQLTQFQRLSRLSELVGVAKFAGFQEKMCASAQIRVFLEIKESNDFKDLPIQRGDGSLRPAQTMEEICPLVFGKSYRVMAEHAQNLHLLGGDLFDAAERMGLKRHQLRLIRSLPETQQSAIKAAIEAESKNEVVSLIEDLAGQLAQAQAEIRGLEADAIAKDKVLDDKNRRLDKQSRHIAKATPDTVLSELQKEAGDFALEAAGILRGVLRQAVIAIRNHGEEADAHDVFLAGLIGQVVLDARLLREEFNLPDLSNVAELQLARDADQWYVPADPLPEPEPGADKPGKSGRSAK